MKNLYHIKNLQQLIARTIKDNKKLVLAIEQGEDYERDMEVWHGSRNGSKCRVCMAGAVIRTLGVRATDEYRVLSLYSPATRRALRAIDKIRRGCVPDFPTSGRLEQRRLQKAFDIVDMEKVWRGDISEWERLNAYMRGEWV